MGFLDDILGGAGGKQQALYKKIKKVYRHLEGKQAADWQQALGYLTQANTARNEGFDRSRKQLDQVGAGARMSIMDEFKRGRAQVNAGSFANTTVASSLQRGLATDAQRRMTELDSSLAGLYAQFEQGAGNARAMGLENLANFWTSRNDAQNQLWGRRLGFMQGVQYENDIGIGDLAKIGGMFAGGGGA